MELLQQQLGSVLEWVKLRSQPTPAQTPSVVVGLLVGTIRRLEMERSLAIQAYSKQQERIEFLEGTMKDRVIRPVHEAKVRRLEAVSAELEAAKAEIAALQEEVSMLRLGGVS